MPLITFSYTVTASLTAPASDFGYALRVLPAGSERQQILRLHYDIHEGENSAEKTDPLGNRIVTGTRRGTSKKLSCSVQGKAIIDANQLEGDGLGVYRDFTERTKSGGLLRLFYVNHTAIGDALDRARYFCRAVREDHRVETLAPAWRTAEDALESHAGSPEDIAHIVLALCRLDMISIRYAVGLNANGFAVWLEVWNGWRWTPIDPVTGELCDHTYLKLAHGRDGDDTTMVGLSGGLTISHCEVHSSLTETEATI